LRGLAEHLRLDYAQFLELEIFTRFGGMVDERTRRTIEHGRRIRAVLTQSQYSGLTMPQQVALLLALDDGMIDSLPLLKVNDFRTELARLLDQQESELLNRIKSTGILDETAQAKLRKVASGLVTGITASVESARLPER
jgi:F-type H+-transporting ATPase subunit alpha